MSKGLCIFTEGIPNKTVADPITPAQARNLIYTLIMDPQAGCKTCGRIPIHYPNVTNGVDNGGILKVDYKSDDNCIGTCVGPNYFTTASATPSATAKSAANRVETSGLHQGLWLLLVMTT
jgi:hypothetical protein